MLRGSFGILTDLFIGLTVYTRCVLTANLTFSKTTRHTPRIFVL